MKEKDLLTDYQTAGKYMLKPLAGFDIAMLVIGAVLLLVLSAGKNPAAGPKAFIICLVIALAFSIFALLMQKNVTKKMTQQLKNDPMFTQIAQDYSSSSYQGQSIYRNYNIIVTPSFCINITAKNYQIIPLDGIQNAYRSRIHDGEIQDTSYFVLEFEDRYVHINTGSSVSKKTYQQLDAIAQRIRTEHSLLLSA